MSSSSSGKIAAQAQRILDSWNLERRVKKSLPRFVSLGAGAYQTVSDAYAAANIGKKVTQSACKPVLILSLETSVEWITIRNSNKFIPPLLYDTLTDALAQYVLHSEWTTISGGGSCTAP